ncbi:glycogenin glucosyltransferase [Dimargaris verticillata]|uniref:glycogenin glucosyltransferase n=1 Tax=Dimargaris verticillata TaxID=2761393 RepID=A0A9W8B935_9FUNG|nr:glycogenin glucosyltransferase [Dimargaris verticillata]
MQLFTKLSRDKRKKSKSKQGFTNKDSGVFSDQLHSPSLATGPELLESHGSVVSQTSSGIGSCGTDGSGSWHPSPNSAKQAALNDMYTDPMPSPTIPTSVTRPQYHWEAARPRVPSTASMPHASSAAPRRPFSIATGLAFESTAQQGPTASPARPDHPLGLGHPSASRPAPWSQGASGSYRDPLPSFTENEPSQRPLNNRVSAARPQTMFQMDPDTKASDKVLPEESFLDPPARPFARPRAGSVGAHGLLSKASSGSLGGDFKSNVSKLFSLGHGNRSSQDMARPKGGAIDRNLISPPVLIHPSHALNDLGPTLRDLADDEIPTADIPNGAVTSVSSQSTARPTSPSSQLSPPMISPQSSQELESNRFDPNDNWFSRVHRKAARPTSYHPGAMLSGASGASPSPNANHRRYSPQTRPRSTFVNLSAQTTRMPAAAPGATSADPDASSVAGLGIDLGNEALFSALIATALIDSQRYPALTLEDADAMKNDQSLLHTRIQALESRLALEMKMRDAANSLIQLHANSKKMSKQAQEQLKEADRKVAQVVDELYQLSTRSFQNQEALFKHTAAVLRHGYVTHRSNEPSAATTPAHHRPVRTLEASTTTLPTGADAISEPADPSGVSDLTVAAFLEQMRELESRLVALSDDHQATEEALHLAQDQLDNKDTMIQELREELERLSTARPWEAARVGSRMRRQSTTSLSNMSLNTSTSALSPGVIRTSSFGLDGLDTEATGVSLPSWTQDNSDHTMTMQLQVDELQRENKLLVRRLRAMEASHDVRRSNSALSLHKVPPLPDSPTSKASTRAEATGHHGPDDGWEEDMVALDKALTKAIQAKEAVEATLQQETDQHEHWQSTFSLAVSELERLVPTRSRLRSTVTTPAAPSENCLDRLRSLVPEFNSLFETTNKQSKLLDRYADRTRALLSQLPEDFVTDQPIGAALDPDQAFDHLMVQIPQLVGNHRDVRQRLLSLELRFEELQEKHQAQQTMDHTSPMDAPQPEARTSTATTTASIEVTELESRLSHQSLELAALREELDTAETKAADLQVDFEKLQKAHKTLQLRFRDKDEELAQRKLQMVPLQQQLVECQRTHSTPAMVEKERKRLFAEHEAQLNRIRVGHTAQLHKVHGQYMLKEKQAHQRDASLRSELNELTAHLDRLSKRCQDFDQDRRTYEDRIDKFRHQVFALETTLAQIKVDGIIGWSDSPYLARSSGDGMGTPRLGSPLPLGMPRDPPPTPSLDTAFPTGQSSFTESQPSGNRSNSSVVPSATAEATIANGSGATTPRASDGDAQSVASSTHPSIPDEMTQAQAQQFRTTLATLGAEKFAKYYPHLMTLRDEFRELVSDLRSQHHAQLDGLAQANNALQREVQDLRRRWDDRAWNLVNRAAQTDIADFGLEEQPMVIEVWKTVTRDDYVAGAVVLAQSLRATGTHHALVCLATPGLLTSNGLARLQAGFDTVLPVGERNSNDTTNLDLLGRPDLGCTWTKLELWRLTNYDKVIYLDADTLVLANLDDLFTTKAEFAAAPDVGWPDCFNSGVMVCQPNHDTYQRLVTAASHRGSFDGGDQGLLNDYFSHWSTSGPEHRLAFTDNFVSTSFYSYLPAFNRFKQCIRVVHFIGTSKPWRCHRFSDGQVRMAAGTHATAYPYLEQWWRHHDTFLAQFHAVEETFSLPPESIKSGTLVQPGEPQFYKQVTVPPLYQPDAQIRGPLPTPSAPLDHVTLAHLHLGSPAAPASAERSTTPSPQPTSSGEPQAFPSHYEAPPWVPDFTPASVYRSQSPPPHQELQATTVTTPTEPSYLPPIERVSSFPREFSNAPPVSSHAMMLESSLPTLVPHALYDHAYHQPHRHMPQEPLPITSETSLAPQAPAHGPAHGQPHFHRQHTNAQSPAAMVASSVAQFPGTVSSTNTPSYAPPHGPHQYHTFANHDLYQAPSSELLRLEQTTGISQGQNAAEAPAMPLRPSSLSHTWAPRPSTANSLNLPTNHKRVAPWKQSDETLDNLLQTFHEHLANITLPNFWLRPGHLTDQSASSHLPATTLDCVLTTLGLEPTLHNRERLTACLEQLSLRQPMASSTTTHPVILPLPFDHTFVIETTVPDTRASLASQQWCTRMTFQSKLADTSALPEEFQRLNLHHVDASSVNTHTSSRPLPHGELPLHVTPESSNSSAPLGSGFPNYQAPSLPTGRTDATPLRTKEANIFSPLQEASQTSIDATDDNTAEPQTKPTHSSEPLPGSFEQGFPFGFTPDDAGNGLDFADYRVDWDEQELGWVQFNPLSQLLRKHRAQQGEKRQ